MKKSFLFKWVSILGAVLLLATSVMPGLIKVYASWEWQYSDSTWEWMYVNDEATWDASFENWWLAKYYAAYPDEDLWSTTTNSPEPWFNDKIYTVHMWTNAECEGDYEVRQFKAKYYSDAQGEKNGTQQIIDVNDSDIVYYIPLFFDKPTQTFELFSNISGGYNGTVDDLIGSCSRWIKVVDVTYGENVAHSWSGAVNAPGSTLPWIVVNFKDDFYGKIKFSYTGKEDVYPWSRTEWTSSDFWVASLYKEFQEDNFSFLTWWGSFNFEIDKFNATLVPFHSLTIHYKYSNWDDAAGDYTWELLDGDEYSHASPDIENYTPDVATVSGTIADDVEVTVTYSLIMTSSSGAMIEQEDETGTWMVVEADTPATSTDASAVQSSNSTATVQWEVELDVYNDADWDWVADGTDPISTKVNFTNPVLVRIPVSSWTSVKVKVKHNGESTFGIEWLTTNSGASCADWVSDAAYDGSEIPANWFAEIWTCSASTFVAYTEEANPSSPSNGGSWGGGGSSKTTKADDAKATTGDDAAVNETNAGEDNWENAEEQKPTMTEAQAVEKFGQEQIDAYKWALENGITTMKTIEAARLDEPLTRAELAKMMVVYIQKVVQKDPVVTGDVSYSDVSEELGDLYGYIKLAYQYQIMWINADGTPIELFNPYGIVSRWEYATVFSRVLFGAKFNKDGEDFYTNHLEALKTAEILTNTTPSIQEMRGWVMLMMYRSSQNGEAIEKVVTATEENKDETKAEETTNAESTTGDTAETPTAEETSEAVAENGETSAEATTWDVAEVNTWTVAETTTWDTASS